MATLPKQTHVFPRKLTDVTQRTLPCVLAIGLILANCGCEQSAAPPAGGPGASETPAIVPVPGAATIDTGKREAKPLGPPGQWKDISGILDSAEMHQSPIERTPQGEFRCTVKTDGIAVVAAPRSFPKPPAGTMPRPAEPAVIPPPVVPIADEVPGWDAIGTIRCEVPARDERTLFRRAFKAGEKFE